MLLVISFARLILSAPNALISQEALLLKLYIRSSMFVRLPAALKISVVNTTDICLTGLSFLGGYCLLVSASMGVLLTLLLAVYMLLLFPEKKPCICCLFSPFLSLLV